MSFILDALRKSDARRQQSSAPGLNSPEPPRPQRRRKRRWPWMAAALVLLVVVAAGVYVTMPQGWLPGAGDTRQARSPEAVDPSGETAARDASATPAGSTTDTSSPAESEPLAQAESSSGSGEADVTSESRASAEPAPAERTRERRRRRTPSEDSTPTQGVQAEPRQRESTPVPSDEAAEELRRRVAEAQRRQRESSPQPSSETSSRDRNRVVENEPRATTAPEPGPVSRAEPEPEAGAESLNENVAEYLRAWELPLSVRRSLPELKLTIHVYSPNEPERFVLINGERRVAGDEIGGARIVEINREGAVVDFRSHRFLLEPR